MCVCIGLDAIVVLHVAMSQQVLVTESTGGFLFCKNANGGYLWMQVRLSARRSPLQLEVPSPCVPFLLSTWWERGSMRASALSFMCR